MNHAVEKASAAIALRITGVLVNFPHVIFLHQPKERTIAV